MEKNILKISLVFSIALLFFVTTTIPIVNSNIMKITSITQPSNKNYIFGTDLNQDIIREPVKLDIGSASVEYGPFGFGHPYCEANVYNMPVPADSIYTDNVVIDEIKMDWHISSREIVTWMDHVTIFWFDIYIEGKKVNINTSIFVNYSGPIPEDGYLILEDFEILPSYVNFENNHTKIINMTFVLNAKGSPGLEYGKEICNIKIQPIIRPIRPEIEFFDGPSSGFIDVSNYYSSIASHSYGNVYKILLDYGFNWTGKIGDMELEVDEWVKNVESDNTVCMKHVWNKPGRYNVSFIAQVSGTDWKSDWYDPPLKVTIFDSPPGFKNDDFKNDDDNEIEIDTNFNLINQDAVLDQEQIEMDYGMPIEKYIWGSQSFKPGIFQHLKYVKLLLRKSGNPSGNLIVSIRNDLFGDDLKTVSFNPSEISSSYKWVECNFSVLTMWNDRPYYIICKTEASGFPLNCYYWAAKENSLYDRGEAWQYTADGSYWGKLENTDYAFQTYGLPITPQTDPFPPITVIEKPKEDAIYFNNKELTNIKNLFNIPIIIGPIELKVRASDGQSGVDSVEFLLDNQKIGEGFYNFNDGYYYFTLDEISFGKKTLTVWSIDNDENIDNNDIEIYYFNIKK